ncbi:MAG TPA: hypothetical protein PLT63_01290 [Syntrophales bacterium]|jgi:hypothetical protein|nr:hypothetical protein [Syntrophales bacterium]
MPMNNNDVEALKSKAKVAANTLYRICHTGRRSAETMELLDITSEVLALLNDLVDSLNADASSATNDDAYVRAKIFLNAWSGRVNG